MKKTAIGTSANDIRGRSLIGRKINSICFSLNRRRAAKAAPELVLTDCVPSGSFPFFSFSPLPLRRRFTSRPSFPSAARSAPGSPRMRACWARLSPISCPDPLVLLRACPPDEISSGMRVRHQRVWARDWRFGLDERQLRMREIQRVGIGVDHRLWVGITD